MSKEKKKETKKTLKDTFNEYLENMSKSMNVTLPNDKDKFYDFVYHYAKANKVNNGFGLTLEIYNELVDSFNNDGDIYQNFLNKEKIAKAKAAAEKIEQEKAKEVAEKEKVKKQQIIKSKKTAKESQMDLMDFLNE